jgi:hypothetical protein
MRESVPARRRSKTSSGRHRRSRTESERQQPLGLATQKNGMGMPGIDRIKADPLREARRCHARRARTLWEEPLGALLVKSSGSSKSTPG